MKRSGSSPPPEVSVLVPFRDSSEFMEEALGSLRAQDLENFEAVLVDDGSRDESLDIARSFASADGRFRVIPSSGEGIVAALNTGLADARGTWIARMDADDVCMPPRLSLQMEMARRLGDRFVIGCRVSCTGTAGEGWRHYERWINALTSHDEIERNIFVESPIPHPTALFGREAVLARGGYREGDFPEDYELWLRLWAAGFRFCKVPQVLLNWRDSNNRLSRTSRRYSTSAFFRTKSAYLRYASALKGHDRVIIWGAGEAGKNLTDCIRPHGLEVEAFVDISPRRIGGTARGRPVIRPEELTRVRGDAGGVPVLAAVRSRGGRESVRDSLDGIGLRNWLDYILCS